MAEDRADVAIIMGSQSDWATMRHAAETLDALGVAYEARIVSAHRTPERLYEFATGAKAAGFKVIIAGAGGAAHLPGMIAALTPLPVFGVPVESKALSGQDSLLSIVQMPAGIPVGTLAIGEAGAINAALLAAAVLALGDDGAGRTARRLAGAPDGGRRRTFPRTRHEPAAAARLHDRHSRRRPARPHAGAGRGAARLPHRHSGAAGAIAPPRGRRARSSPPMTTRRRWPSWRGESTSSPTSSRTCRSGGRGGFPASVPVYPPAAARSRSPRTGWPRRRSSTASASRPRPSGPSTATPSSRRARRARRLRRC